MLQDIEVRNCIAAVGEFCSYLQRFARFVTSTTVLQISWSGWCRRGRIDVKWCHRCGRGVAVNMSGRCRLCELLDLTFNRCDLHPPVLSLTQAAAPLLVTFHR